MTEDFAPYFTNPAEMIKYLRKKQGMTVVELAQRMGVSQAYIVGIEQGKIKPVREQVDLILSFIDKKL